MDGLGKKAVEYNKLHTKYRMTPTRRPAYQLFIHAAMRLPPKDAAIRRPDEPMGK